MADFYQTVLDAALRKRKKQGELWELAGQLEHDVRRRLNAIKDQVLLDVDNKATAKLDGNDPDIGGEWKFGEQDSPLIVQLLMIKGAICFRVESALEPFEEPDDEEKPGIKTSREVTDKASALQELDPLLLEATGLLPYTSIGGMDFA